MQWAKNKHGFTIVELLIVVVVIAILAAISIVAYNGIQERARDSERVSDMAAIQKILEAYYIDHNRYPTRGEMQNATWRQENLITPDQSPFINPLDKGSPSSITASGSVVTINKYSYYEVPTGVGSGYRINYKLESDPSTNVNIYVDK